MNLLLRCSVGYRWATGITAANADSGSSSTIGTAIGVLVFGTLFLAIYGWFSPYHPNGAWANAAR